jgi:hypothetical protein
MKITVQRYSTSDESTLGLLSIDGRFYCYTLEDAWHMVKQEGVTRIPEGIYEVQLRNGGGMTQRYAKRFPFHQGMLWLRQVPDYSWVYIHTGNKAKHSKGCLLVGMTANCNKTQDGFVGNSSAAYKMIYCPISQAILEGEDVTIEVT